MTDVHNKETRRKNMAAVRSENTAIEMLVRRELHRRGLRYRLNNKHIIGKPDLIFPLYNAVLFIHGCFWHRHQCRLFRWPQTRRDFWHQKLNGNARRDQRVQRELLDRKLRVGVVWECSLKGSKRLLLSDVVNEIILWLHSGQSTFEIKGKDGD